jgi:hypothetical protein
MHCENPEMCPVWLSPDKPCWEIASAADDYRKANNICRDCIVYVLKAKDSVLTKQEIEKVMEKKADKKPSHWYPRISV